MATDARQSDLEFLAALLVRPGTCGAQSATRMTAGLGTPPASYAALSRNCRPPKSEN